VSPTCVFSAIAILQPVAKIPQPTSRILQPFRFIRLPDSFAVESAPRAPKSSPSNPARLSPNAQGFSESLLAAAWIPGHVYFNP